MTQTRPVRTVAALAVAFAMTGCSQVRSLSSAATPGTPVITFPNSDDRFDSTTIMSNLRAEQAGVDGRTLDVVSYHGTAPIADDLTIDENGNVGVRGSISTQSTRKAKTNIHPFRERALDLIDRTRIVTYHFRGERASSPPHIGFIAEDTPSEISGATHDSFNINNTVALNMKAERELQDEYRALSREVRALRGKLAAMQAAATGNARSRNSRSSP